ncbi:MAG: hypothetical protein ACLUDZ_16845 [Roseburia intestinalis]
MEEIDYFDGSDDLKKKRTDFYHGCDLSSGEEGNEDFEAMDESK